ncbi:hypothetical protein EDC56_0051 [Sinobacterium caligoides]|uniref:Uncharacterized protein n=1 Tax=Sinobacterium caligoides TaxID=933926 RepID=A0A3N2E231_9GAMM|nr:hypothetical protein [Sinobacterium caligoides]ROS06144.1 hypothetical protein EDC56_0051 [Sinobacterium caligoides]
MKTMLTITIITLNLLNYAHAAESTVDDADSLNFSNFHKDDKIKLIDSEKPQKAIMINGEKKTTSTNKNHIATAQYQLTSNRHKAEQAVQEKAALLCPKGWREADQWIKKNGNKFTINYEFSCR